MKIKTNEVGGVAVLEVSGEMYGGPENMKLVEVLNDLSSSGKKNAVIDMSKVKWIASTGLGILVKARTTYTEAGGTLRLCGLNERVLTLLQITKMNSMFQVHASQSEAVAAFQS